jgi:hypothetical protein
MTVGRGFWGQESCLRMFFHWDGVLDADDTFSGKDKKIQHFDTYSSLMLIFGVRNFK